MIETRLSPPATPRRVGGWAGFGTTAADGPSLPKSPALL